jgi:hypothetical protein
LSQNTTSTRKEWDTGATVDISGGLRAGTKLCLGCHDGSTALDAFSRNMAGTTFISSSFRVGVGGDFTSDHPIGVLYPSSGPYNPTSTPFGSRGTIADALEEG